MRLSASVPSAPHGMKTANTTMGEIHAIYATPARWAGGAGSALLAEGEQRLLVDVGSKEATLWVLKQNRRTRGWYERRGWQRDGCRREKKLGGAVLTELRYRRRLQKP